MHQRIIIIGAGLTGLSLAYLLKQRGIDAQLLEARERIGGRIHTTMPNGASAPMEMGATWLGKKHQYLRALLAELGLEIYPQHLGELAVYEPISTSPPQLVQLPPNNDPSYRIKGGSSALIEALRVPLEETNIKLSQWVQKITQQADGSLAVQTDKATFVADKVVITLPPYLWQQQLELSPPAPEELSQLASHTHTWMGDSIKVGLSYAKAFWHEGQTSGTIFSSVGPIPEMYDQSDFAGERFALVGFLNGAYANTNKEHRLKVILQQLEKYYGPQVRDYLTYEEGVWAEEPYTYAPYHTPLLPHQNNGRPLLRSQAMNGQLIFAGSETAPQHPGYMDGAVQSAHLALAALGDVRLV